MELKVITWNIQGAAALSWNRPYEIKKNIVDKIFEQKADIAVLTEFVISKGWDYFQEQLEKKGYIWFMTNTTGKNGILIFINKDLVYEKNLVQSLYQENAISSNTDGCNILRITLPMSQNKTLTIMGVRMETGISKASLKAQYDAEREALDNILLPKIELQKPNNMYIVCGDFNNARCLGNLTENFNADDYKGKAQIGYNLNIIKDTFDNLGFAMADIGEPKHGITHGIPTWDGYIPNDHIFVRGFKVMKCESEKVKKCESETDKDLPDHDIIWAELECETIKQTRQQNDLLRFGCSRLL